VSVSVGIIGLEHSGKTALFKALTRGPGVSERTVATVPVPDERLQVLADMVHPKRIVPASVQFVDFGAISRGATASGSLGAQFLSYLQGVDALAIVLRFYSRPDIGFGPEPPTPLEDLESILLELGLSDLARIERRLERVSKAARSGDMTAQREERVLRTLQAALNEGRLARHTELSANELVAIKDLGLLTLKPMIYVANVAEGDLAPAIDPEAPDPNGVRPVLRQLEEIAHHNGSEVAVVSAQLEAELTDLPEAEAREYLASLGISDTGLNRFIRATYRLLGLLTFFTANEQEARAWTVHQGARAPEAAGQVHSDMERGFIRAEVTAWEDLVAAGSPEEAKRLGKTRLESRDYVMHEGDVVYFRFNV
jgi:GTP-binding protein YchF